MESHVRVALTWGGFIGLVIGGVLVAPLMFEAWQVGRGSDGCVYRSFEIRWDSTWALEAVHGGFQWWPTGLTCTFPIEGGDDYVVRPGPGQSVQFVAAVGVAAAGALASIAAVILKVRQGMRERPDHDWRARA